MRKPASQKRQAINELKFYIRQSRKMARQVNRKLESLARLNQLKAQAKARLVKICELK